MSTTTTPTAVKRDQFRSAVRRNVRTLLEMCGVEQQDLAPAIGLSKSQMSDRLTCSTAWKDEELLNVAHAFGVSYEVVVALTADDFHSALSALDSPPVFHASSDSVQLDLFQFAA